MSLVHITLSEEEQQYLVLRAAQSANPHLGSIARKIREANDVCEWERCPKPQEFYQGPVRPVGYSDELPG